MKLYKLTPQKNTAQAMVEFAIVLPLLLLLLYGLLEAGRLLFMYSTIVTASRQAARYGSATGQGGDYTAESGPDNSTLSRFEDCYGIKRAAQRVDFLNAFDDDDIVITYDDGPGTAGTDPSTDPPATPPWKDICDGSGDSAVDPTDNATRIVVTIRGDFLPIIPRIVPFIARTRAGGNPIRAISARTIITGVPIEVTPPPGSGPGPGSGSDLSLLISPAPAQYAALNEQINYTFTITNNSSTNITGPFTVSGAPFAVDCSAATSPLTPGASTSCAVVAYFITQADIDAGSFVVTATVTGTASDGTPVTSDPGSAIITYYVPPVVPAISLSKSASTTLATVGDSITYRFTLTNSGNVTLSPPYTVSDDIMGPLDCSSSSGNLAPLASVTCTPVYVVNSDAIRQNQVINTATATALFGSQTVTSNQASATVDIYTGRLFLTVSASPASTSQVGQAITYTYTIKNNWNQDLTDPYALSVSLPNSGCSFSTGVLAPGASTTCTGTYTVTQADFEAGVIRNTVKASATRNNNTEDSNTVTIAVTVTGQNPALSLQATASPTGPTPPTKMMTVGTPINYTYTLTNIGNVTLSSPITVTDPAVSNISCSGTSFAPGGTITCTGTHTVVEADLSTGLITSQSTASALYAAKSQTVSASASPITIITYDGPRLSLQITANPTTYPEAGQTIVYTYTLTNTGSADYPLQGPFIFSTVSGPTVSINCTNAQSPLASGASTTCTGFATVSGPPGSSVTYSANARASDGTQQITSNTATVTVTNPVLACNTITGSSLSISGNTMSMTITNPNSYAVTISSIEATWNHDTGQQGNKELKLDRVNFGGVKVWDETSLHPGPSLTFTPSPSVTIPAANPNPAQITIIFTFDSNYGNTDGSEKIKINFSTVGCEATPVQQPPATP